MTDASEHQQIRERLGSYALGHLSSTEADAVRAHLDGCASCRADLAEIAPVATALSSASGLRLDDFSTPPPDLGARIRAQVAGERELRDARAAKQRQDAQRHRSTMHRLLGAAAAVVLLLGLGTGVLLGRASSPNVPKPVATESIALRPVGAASVSVDSAKLVAHSWGVELRMVAHGFTTGQVFLAEFRDRAGDEIPGGEFLGQGKTVVTCNLQSGLLRTDAVRVDVVDANGTRWLTATI